jgi:phage-related minor tail protein
MPIIEQKKIYDPSKGNPVEQLTKDLNLLVDVEKVLIKQNKELAKSLQLIKKSGDGKEAEQLAIKTDRLAKSTVKLKEVKTASVRVNEQLTKARVKLVESQTKEAKELAKVNAQLAKNKKELRDSAKEVIKLDNAYDELVRSTNQAQKNFKRLAAQFGVNSKQAQNARKEFDKLDDRLRTINTASKDGRRDVGRYGTALKGVGGQLLGAAGIVGGVDLAIQGFKEFAKTTKELNDLTKRIGTNFGLTGTQADHLAARINGLAETFGEDYNEVLQAANVVSKEFGITGQEATALIEEGFLKGSNNSGEFLDIIKEYPTQLRSIGLTASESFAIINQQVTQGVYSDKGIDALKEAGLRLNDINKGYQASLAPLDENTKLQIENAIASGDVFEATQLISKGIKENGLDAAQTNEILAKVFGAAGEDARSFVENLDQVSLSLSDVAIQSSESEQASLALSQSWNRFVAGVSDSDGIFGKVFARLKSLLAGAINSLTFLIEKLSGGDKAVDRIRAAIERLKQSTEEQTTANNNLATSTVKLTAAQRKQLQAEKDLNAERERRKKLLTDLGTLEEIETRTTDTQVQQTELAPVAGGFLRPEVVDEAENLTKKIIKFRKQEQKNAAEDELQREFDLQAAKAKIRETFITESTQFASDLFAQSQDDELARITSDNEAKKALLEDQLQKGVISQADFNRQIDELNKKQRIAEGKAEKRKALFDIAINTAVAAVKALPNFIKVAAVVASGAIQAAAVAARPIPGFFEGTESVPLGGNKKGKDTILAKVNEGERIVPTSINNKIPSGVTNEMLPEMISRGLMFDTSSGMRKTQKDSLIASLLMKGLSKKDEMIMALMNLASTEDYGGYIRVTKGSGQTSIHNKG